MITTCGAHASAEAAEIRAAQPVLEVVRSRYGEESRACDSLGCGDNFRYLDLRPGEDVLDLGCGAGRDVLKAVRLVGPTGRAVGIDATPAMVRAAEAERERLGIANATFAVGEIEEIPLPDGCVDVVMSDCALNHVQDKGRGYFEIFRVLKPGGRFVVSDPVSEAPLPPEVKSDPQAWAECYGGAITEDEHLAILRNLGFERIEVLERRRYLKNGYPFASLTFRGWKPRDSDSVPSKE